MCTGNYSPDFTWAAAYGRPLVTAFSAVTSLSTITVVEIAASPEGSFARAVSGEVYSFGKNHLARCDPALLPRNAPPEDAAQAATAYWKDRILPKPVAFPETEGPLPIPPVLIKPRRSRGVRWSDEEDSEAEVGEDDDVDN